MLGSIPLFVLLYACYVFFMPYYSVVVIPAVIFGILLGARALPKMFPRIGRGIESAMFIFIVIVAIAALPQWDATADDQIISAPLLQSVNNALSTLTNKPAIVLFRYDPHRNVNEEPVFNANVAWPDDAQIVRAHDRGAENLTLFRYYAEHQPDRAVYLFDEHDQSLHPLGNVKQLASVSQ